MNLRVSRRAVVIAPPAWNGLNALANPALAGWPDATNTGVPSGTSLSPSGDVTTSSNGQVIDSLDITGKVTINHTGVIVRKCRITADDFWAVSINAASATVEDCDITNNGSLGCIEHTATGDDSVILRCDISAAENGIRIWGQDGGRVEDCYLHGFTASGDPHYDGLELFAGSNIIIRHNTIILDQVQTSPVNLAPDVSSTDYLIDRNLIDGGGWQLNIRNNEAPLTNVQLTNNRLGDNHAFGYGAVDPGTTSVVSGNVRDLTGVNIDGDL